MLVAGAWSQRSGSRESAIVSTEQREDDAEESAKTFGGPTCSGQCAKTRSSSCGGLMRNGCVVNEFPAGAGSSPGIAVPSVTDGWADDVDDRRALAREVHDWIGTGVALALHQLDLFAIAAARGEPDASARVS